MSDWDDHVSFVEYTALKRKVDEYAATQTLDGNEMDPELDGET